MNANAQDISRTISEALASRIQDIARRVFAWMESNGKTQSWMVRTFDSLGSPRTMRDMRDGSVDGYDLETQLANYQAAWSMIEAKDPSSRGERLIATLSPVTLVKRSVLEATLSSGNDRVIIALGDSGVGKTCMLRAIAQAYDTAVYVEAKEVWGDSPGAMLADFLQALGEDANPASPAASLFRSAVALMCKRRCTLLVDEAHHMGRRCLNTLKGLVNATPGEFVLAAQPTLWTNLQKLAYLELRQLTTNRLRARISINLNLPDVVAYVAARFPKLTADECKDAALVAIDKAANLGNMSFVRDVCTAASRKAEDPERPDRDAWIKAEAVTAASK
jgi:type II secretory pathway predicted ATPase ExeA